MEDRPARLFASCMIPGRLASWRSSLFASQAVFRTLTAFGPRKKPALAPSHLRLHQYFQSIRGLHFIVAESRHLRSQLRWLRKDSWFCGKAASGCWAGMDFRWKSQTDESPASSGSDTEPFYSYSAAAAARSNEDLDVYNALFGSNEAGSSRSVLGLTSMDFWNMDDVKPMTGTSSSQSRATYATAFNDNRQSGAYTRSQQNTFAPAQPARESSYGDTYSALGNADTPDAVMVFDDMQTGETYKSVASVTFASIPLRLYLIVSALLFQCYIQYCEPELTCSAAKPEWFWPDVFGRSEPTNINFVRGYCK